MSDLGEWDDEPEVSAPQLLEAGGLEAEPEAEEAAEPEPGVPGPS